MFFVYLNHRFGTIYIFIFFIFFSINYTILESYSNYYNKNNKELFINNVFSTPFCNNIIDDSNLLPKKSLDINKDYEEFEDKKSQKSKNIEVLKKSLKDLKKKLLNKLDHNDKDSQKDNIGNIKSYNNQDFKDIKIDKKDIIDDKKKFNDQNKDEDSKKKLENNQFEEPKKVGLSWSNEGTNVRMWGRLRFPEFFYGKNLRWLNNHNPTDQVVYVRHTLDLSGEYAYSRTEKDNKKYDILLAKVNLRNKGIWGDAESIATTSFAEIKDLDTVLGPHRHGIPRHFMWIREIWIQLALNEMLGLSFCNYHSITFGSFPFQLGRGIALGDAYSFDASDIGYVSDISVDQFAFGAKLSGEIIQDYVVYDLYTAILDNKSDTFDATNAKVRAQQYGHRSNQSRGFGVVNFIFAGRTKCNIFKDDSKKINIMVEPYGLYNYAPEQKVEYIADARSQLISLGISFEGIFNRFEFGFDTAFNLGHQHVYGWDRNIIIKENRAGITYNTNSRVRQAPPGQIPDPLKSPLAVYTPENQEIINNSIRSADENGQIIGVNSLGTLINDLNRFTDPYTNLYRGYFFVTDMSFYLLGNDLKISGTLGYASGDENPNKDLQERGDSEVNGVYKGFIGLLENYSGVRVTSAFLLNGQGRIPRILSFTSKTVNEPFSSSISRFTNLLFTGYGLNYHPKDSKRKWLINPNILFYWQDTPVKLPPDDDKVGFDKFARTYLGSEINTFLECKVITDLRFFSIIAIFVPGGYYQDIKGRPLNKAQQVYFNNRNKTGIISDRVPLLGTNTSYFLNAGLEYRF